MCKGRIFTKHANDGVRVKEFNDRNEFRIHSFKLFKKELRYVLFKNISLRNTRIDHNLLDRSKSVLHIRNVFFSDKRYPIQLFKLGIRQHFAGNELVDDTVYAF